MPNNNDQYFFRIKKDKSNPYVMINKTLAQSIDLSAKEKGIMFYLLSLPDDWKIHMRELAKHFKDGRDSIYSGVRGLIRKGYIERIVNRRENGQVIGYEYFVYEAPQPLKSTAYGKSGNGNPVTTNNDITNNERIIPDNVIFISTDDIELSKDKAEAEAEYWHKLNQSGHGI